MDSDSINFFAWYLLHFEEKGCPSKPLISRQTDCHTYVLWSDKLLSYLILSYPISISLIVYIMYPLITWDFSVFLLELHTYPEIVRHSEIIRLHSVCLYWNFQNYLGIKYIRALLMNVLRRSSGYSQQIVIRITIKSQQRNCINYIIKY